MASFTERVLILCKTYPSPSAKYAETSCVAGMTEDGRLIRLYPVPFRLVSDDQQFKKWQWITARFEKARDDHRPESHRVFVDTNHAVSNKNKPKTRPVAVVGGQCSIQLSYGRRFMNYCQTEPRPRMPL